MNRLQARKKFYPTPLNPQDITSKTNLNNTPKRLNNHENNTTKQYKATQYTQHPSHNIPNAPATIHPIIQPQYTQTERAKGGRLAFRYLCVYIIWYKHANEA